jgi:hypothetical protein
MGGGAGAVGGTADSELTYSDSNANYLQVTSNAYGGAGGLTNTGAAGNGGFATATASGTSSVLGATVDVNASVTGGAGGQTTEGGTAGAGASESYSLNGDTNPVTATGSSTNYGYLSITASATGGAGGEGDGGVNGGAAGSAQLVNAVSGSTSGVCTSSRTRTAEPAAPQWAAARARSAARRIPSSPGAIPPRHT